VPIKFAVIAIGVAVFTVAVAGVVVGERLADRLSDSPSEQSEDAPTQVNLSDGAEPEEAPVGASPAKEEVKPDEQSDPPRDDEESGSADSEPPPPDCLVDVAEGQFTPLYATGSVVGLGRDAHYVIFESCPGPTAFVEFQSRTTATYTEVELGGCLYHRSFEAAWLAFLLNPEVDLRPRDSEPDHFQAVFNNPQTRELLSISDGGPQSAVSGTYNYGAPVGGERRGGHQWTIYSDDRLQYSYARSSLIDVDSLSTSGLQLVVGEITAVWSGLSSDDFDPDGEETIGTVTVSCAYATARPRSGQ
jgi:hypothetical protein